MSEYEKCYHGKFQAAANAMCREYRLEMGKELGLSTAEMLSHVALQAAGVSKHDVWLSTDLARLALFDAIRDIKFGNPTDDKLILENLRKSGLWIGRIESKDQ